jgi:predicted MFS family arabinose efflux permease
MAVALYPLISLGVLSRFVLADLGISRAQLGLAVAVAAGTSALAGIALGRLADRYGGRIALITVFGLSALAMIGIAAAYTYALLLCVAAIAGLALGSANSATNRFVAETVPAGQRGTITGVKQAGESITIVVCGVLLPFAALSVGWRLALAVSAAVPAAAIVLAVATIPARPRLDPKTPASGPRGALDSDIFWLAGFTLFTGLAGGSVATYLPLYAQESLNMSASAAGLVVALMGIVASIGRVSWGHFVRNASDLRGRLRTIAVLAVGATLLLWSASRFHPDLVWFGAAAWGISLLSAGTVGMVAVMTYAGLENTGRASGVVLTGFGVGLMIGPPLFGWTVDTTGTYDVGFALVLAEVASAALIGFFWGRRARQSRGPLSSVP